MTQITPIYAAAITLLMAILSTRVGMLRGKYAVALGDGGQSGLALPIRHFGNLAEYAPMAIVLLLLMEMSGVASSWLHAYGLALLALRLLHPFVLFDDMAAPTWKKAGRFLAASGTAGLMAAAAVTLLVGN